MIWSSNTDPQFVQTASPLAGSLSISVQPQWVQTPVLDIVDASQDKKENKKYTDIIQEMHFLNTNKDTWWEKKFKKIVFRNGIRTLTFLII